MTTPPQATPHILTPEIIDQVQRLMTSGPLTVNEIRAAVGLPLVEGAAGDMLASQAVFAPVNEVGQPVTQGGAETARSVGGFLDHPVSPTTLPQS